MNMNPESLRCEEGSLVAFFHINACEKGFNIAKQELSILESSGLWDKISFLAVGIDGKEQEECDKMLSVYNRKIYVVGRTEGMKFEYPTLSALQVFSQNNPKVRVCYFHTKGTRPYQGPTFILQANWRRMALHFMMERHMDCLELLERYVAVGVNLKWNGAVPLHFAGNFWWAWTDHLATLYDFGKIAWAIQTRFFNEYWVCSRDMGRICSIHNSNIDHYRQYYPEERYMNEENAEYVLKDGKVVNVKEG